MNKNIECKGIGHHVLEVKLRMHVVQDDKEYYKGEIPLRAEFDILPNVPENSDRVIQLESK